MDIDIWRPLAGLGLFLYSMRVIETALEQVSGSAFRRLLRRNTEPPIRGIVSGTAATAVLQSSSLVGLMMLALVGSGVIRMRNALAVIFGANLGTTATGWIVATLGFKLDLDIAALPLIGLGGLSAVAFTNPRICAYARFVLGVGLLLLGLQFMKSSVGAVADLLDPAMLADLSAFEYLLFGLAFSAIVQSSSATMMVTLSALYGGVIDLPAAASIAIGADLGTTGTVLIGAFRGSPAKKRVAAGHLLFNLATDSLAFLFRLPLLGLVLLLNLSELMSLVAFHSLFNLLGIIAFLPFISRFAEFLERRFSRDEVHVNRHLAPEAALFPDAAIEAIELETRHLLQRVIYQNLCIFDPPVEATGRLPVGQMSLAKVAREIPRNFEYAYQQSKRLEGEILRFAGEAQTAILDAAQIEVINCCQAAIREGIQSSKDLKDALADLRIVAERNLPGNYPDRFRRAQATFYSALLGLRRKADEEVPAVEILTLDKLNNASHDTLHRGIYDDIRSGVISRSNVSTLLNVNREISNSNRNLVNALATLSAPPSDSSPRQDPLPNAVSST